MHLFPFPSYMCSAPHLPSFRCAIISACKIFNCISYWFLCFVIKLPARQAGNCRSPAIVVPYLVLVPWKPYSIKDKPGSCLSRFPDPPFRTPAQTHAPVNRRGPGCWVLDKWEWAGEKLVGPSFIAISFDFSFVFADGQ